MKIAVVGTGYVGLVTGSCFADSGNEVTCIDNDANKVATLNAGRMPIYEPGLAEMVARNVREGRLEFTTDIAAGVAQARLIFIAVGTPQGDDGTADLRFVDAVADELCKAIKEPKIVVIKSTVPPGTNQHVTDRLAKCEHPVDVCSNPEFLREGVAIEDCLKPNRVVIGVRRDALADVFQELYKPFIDQDRPLLVMSPESAEMTKYAANAILATKISFINEVANLCERVKADVHDVRLGIGHDHRIGFQFLSPGAGYGGSCFEANETVFVHEDGLLMARTLASVFERTLSLCPQGVGNSSSIGNVEVCEPPEPLHVLAFDLESREAVSATVHALTRRQYAGAMMQFKCSMGRTLRVTADHPMIVWDHERERIIRADQVEVGDRIAVVTALPDFPTPDSLDLVDLLAGTSLEPDVLVAPTDNSFTEQYPRYSQYIPQQVLRHPLEIKDNNRMRLSIFRCLRDQEQIDVPTHKLQLYTAKGAGARLNAVLPVDADMARLCGYYLAEGFISRGKGRADAVRERIGFSFHSEEREYIEDVHRILTRWGLKFFTKVEGKSHSTITSSRLLAWVLRDVLGCGTRSEDKALPTFAFSLPAELRKEIIRGAFSGDGSVTEVQGGANLMFEYATVSKRLADGLALLLQSVGIVPTLKERWMNKSRQVAHLLRVSGYEQLRSLQDAFGGKHRERIGRILGGYQRHIRQHGFERVGNLAHLTIRSVERQEVLTPVYSLETSTGTVIASSAMVAHNCFPKDTRAMISLSRKFGLSARILEAVDAVNEDQKRVLVEKVRSHYGQSLAGKTIAVWGLAFKPRTDDIREAPALVLLRELLAAGVRLHVHDPEAAENVRKEFGHSLRYFDRPYGAVEGADGLIIVTEWQQFRTPNFAVIKAMLTEPVIFDGRNLYDPRLVAEAGFTYYSIGRQPVRPKV